MTVLPLFTAALETALNRLLWRDRSLRLARQRLNGAILTFKLKAFSHPLTLIFNEKHLDVTCHWQGESDCTVHTALSELPALRQHRQFTSLIRSGRLDVTGNIQVLQHFADVIDQAQWDVEDCLAPWTGDIIAQGLTQAVRHGGGVIARHFQQKQSGLAQTLTEEWRLMPGALELSWFADEVNATERVLDSLQERLARLEEK